MKSHESSQKEKYKQEESEKEVSKGEHFFHHFSIAYSAVKQQEYSKQYYKNERFQKPGKAKVRKKCIFFGEKYNLKSEKKEMQESKFRQDRDDRKILEK